MLYQHKSPVEFCEGKKTRLFTFRINTNNSQAQADLAVPKQLTFDVSQHKENSILAAKIGLISYGYEKNSRHKT